MEDKTYDPDSIRLFKTLPPEVEAQWAKDRIYEKHLKKIRTFLWVSLIVISVLFYWYGENGRYQKVNDYYYIDTKTGEIFDSNGDPIKSK